MSSVRLRRLTADYEKLSDYAKRHPRLRLIQAEGDPPERYQLEYRIRSLRQVDGELKIIKSHLVEITLPRNYPRTPPQCRMLSPVFHPNIAPHAICVGDHWSAGESLQSIVTRIGEMLAYQSYNVKSPLNGEAARWVAEHEADLPLDRVSLLVEEEAQSSDDAVDADAFIEADVETPEPRRRSIQPTSPQAQAPSLAVSPSPPERRPSEMPPPETRPAKPPAIPPTAPTTSVETAAERVAVNCPSCLREFRVPRSYQGRKAQCQICGDKFVIQLPE